MPGSAWAEALQRRRWHTGVKWCVNTAELARCQAKSPRRLQSLERGRRADAAGVVTVTVVGGYRALSESLPAITRRANSTKVLSSRTTARLYVCDTILEGLAQDLQDVAAALRQFIQKEHPVVRPRHLAGQRHVAPADQADSRDRVVRGAEGAGGDQRHAGAGGAGDAMGVSHHAPVDFTRIAKEASRLKSIEYGLLFSNEVVLGTDPSDGS
jgi:hypothetical protein